jgi:LCP family protein required for cell wall assembly
VKKRVLIVGACAIIVLLAVGAVFAWSTWGDVTRVSIDRSASSDGDSDQGSEGEAGAADDGPVAAPTGPEGLQISLLVGSDSRDELESTEGFGEFAGERADVVMVLIRPADGSRAALLSLPRDLLIDDVCGVNTEQKLTDALGGCARRGMNGPTALILSVEAVIGQTVDHFALIDLAGFQEAVDAVGGYEICLELPVRDQKARLELPAGCTQASGAETLAWLRSRSTQELTDNGWRTVPGVNDLTRNERQRTFLLAMMGQLSDFSSPKDVADVAGVIAPFVTVDSELTFIDAVNLAWALRGLEGGNIEELEIPVTDATTSDGAAVLISDVDIAEMVEEYLAPETVGESTGAFAG